MPIPVPNIPNPDPSRVASERLDEAKNELRREIHSRHLESKGWVEALQILQERELRNTFQLLVEKIEGGLRNVGTRLDGNDTALVAALKAQKEEAAKQTENFKEILGEIKVGIGKQFDSMVDQLNSLKERMSESGGRSHGTSQTVIMIIAGISALASMGAIAISLSRGAPPVVYAQPGLQADPFKPQRQSFPLVPSWDNSLYRVVQ